MGSSFLHEFNTTTACNSQKLIFSIYSTGTKTHYKLIHLAYYLYQPYRLSFYLAPDATLSTSTYTAISCDIGWRCNRCHSALDMNIYGTRMSLKAPSQCYRRDKNWQSGLSNFCFRGGRFEIGQKLYNGCSNIIQFLKLGAMIWQSRQHQIAQKNTIIIILKLIKLIF